MDHEDRRLLRETARLTEENSKILKKLLSAQRWARFFSILRWLVIIGISVGAYYYLAPYIESVTELYGTLLNQSGSSNGSSFRDVIDLFQ